MDTQVQANRQRCHKEFANSCKGPLADVFLSFFDFIWEEDHWCIAAWGGRIGQSYWTKCSCNLPQSLVRGRQDQSTAAATVGVVRLLLVHGRRTKAVVGLVRPQNGRNLSHRLWTVRCLLGVLLPDMGLSDPEVSSSSAEDHDDNSS